MKKTFILLFFVTLFSAGFSQTSLSEAVDFTVTDVEGNEHNLFTYLDDGKYVLIDFFYVACGPCQQTAPKISEAYTYFGCNSTDIVIIGIDTGDSDAEVIAFDETYGSLYPSVSGNEGGGTAVCNTYGITAYPTVILIAPDGEIVEQDIWPIATGDYLISVIEPYGPAEASCGSQTEIITFSIPEQTGEALIEDGTIDIEVEAGTDLASLIPEFTLSDGCVVTIDGEEQTSGESVVDFTSGSVTYSVTAENDDYEEWVVTVTEGATSINNNKKNAIKMFPVPANNIVNITNAKEYALTIYNITGKIILQKDIKSDNEVIDLQSYPTGFYTVSLIKNNNLHTFKLNIER